MLSLLWTSCAIDDDIPIDLCQDEFIGNFVLLQSSKEVFPYHDLPVETSFFFVNETNDEIVYKSSIFLNSLISISIPTPCPADEEVNNLYDYRIEMISGTFQSTQNSMTFQLTLQVRIDADDPGSSKVADEFSVHAKEFGDDFLNAEQVFSMIADQRNSSQTSSTPLFFETIEVNDRTLTNVYKTEIADPFSEIYYSFEFGIVAFTDLDDVQWVLDRIE